MEEILRAYVSDSGNDWDVHLTGVEIALNTSKHSSTEYTPYYLNNGMEMNLPLDHALRQLNTSNSPSATDSIRTMNEDVQRARENIKKAQERQSYYADQHRREADEYKVGDRVMLSTEHLGQSAGKLLSKYIGPFTVTESLADMTVRLELPVHMRLKYNKFHVSKIKMFKTSGMEFPGRIQQDRPAPVVVDGDIEYEVEEVVAKREVQRGRRKYTQYLIKWLGYPMTEATWQNGEELDHAKDVIQDYEGLQGQ